MDLAYANGAFIPGAEAMPGRWREEAAVFRAALGRRAILGLPYGTTERQQFDLFHPEGTVRGLMVFIHGGYWLAFGRESWSHLAAGALARGWAVAIPSYTLSPVARISAITREMIQAISLASTHVVAGPVVVTGHSAGGHLAARMGCNDIDLPMVRRVVPISPLAELEPLMRTTMNSYLCLDQTEVATESPCRRVLRPGVSAHVWVGGQERPAFLWQARTLSEAWGCPWTVMPGRHHFDVIAALTDPKSTLTETCLGDF